MSVLVVLLVAVLVLACVATWLLPATRLPAQLATGAVVVGVGVLGLVALLGGPVADSYGLVSRSLLVPMAVVAVLGGGPVTAAVLRLADREGPGPGGVQDAARVLRGGAWIGSFERAGVFAALIAGWPEGIAVVLALKGLGRYSELKSDGGTSGARPALRRALRRARPPAAASPSGSSSARSAACCGRWPAPAVVAGLTVG